MAARKTLDRQPGPLPQIQADNTSVIFQLDIPGAPDGARLVIRCTDDGEVLVSIVSER